MLHLFSCFHLILTIMNLSILEFKAIGVRENVLLSMRTNSQRPMLYREWRLRKIRCHRFLQDELVSAIITLCHSGKQLSENNIDAVIEGLYDLNQCKLQR